MFRFALSPSVQIRSLVRHASRASVVATVAALAFVKTATGAAKPVGDEFKTLRVGIVVYEGVEVLDFTGPAEVFASAGHSLMIDGKPLFEVVTVAPKKDPVLAHGGVTVLPCYAVADTPKLDVIVIPGGETGSLDRDASFKEWLRAAAADARIVMSVCNGAFVLGDLGLLDGCEATTFHGAIGWLKSGYPKTKVLPGRRVVDNGHVITTGGVSCGIDGALHVCARLGGRRLAESVAEYMEFRWQPEPQLEGTYSEWSTLGGDRTELEQQVRAYRQKRDFAAMEKAARELTDLDPDDGEAWYQLGYALISLKRFDEALSACEESAKFPARRPTALYNAACCHLGKGDSEKALATLGRAVDAGFSDRAWPEKDEDFAKLRVDARFTALLDRMSSAKSDGENGWIREQLETARARLKADDPDGAIRVLVPAMDGDAGEAELRATLQDAIARANASVDDSSAKARRWLAAHPWTGRAVLAPIGEAGARMVVSGIVRDAAGQPFAGAKLHLFHADASGQYRTDHAMDEPNARLNGWIVTGADGRYEFESVRPGGYPQPRGDVAADAGDERWIPQHVHFEVEAAGHATRRFQLVFADDPRMTLHWQKWAKEGEHPVITLVRDEQGVLRGVCDVTLR